ncbi:DUF418 domain-containing protein [Acrocarpospora macrocephala]|uniref:Membrane protein n=2 Tax=Acrocarpospora macrocephala TaxID=150177 RepID=A0A5M3WZK9_9ACTN|nr:membrane protein [Acrocarpospora macrocephala]
MRIMLVSVTTLPRDPSPSLSPLVRRVVEVDMLRGFALFGILVVNISYMASPYGTFGLPDPDFTRAVDDAARLVGETLFVDKFYLLFAFLFGYSFTFQAERAGASVVRRSLRRYGALFLLGAFHAVVLWRGDILTVYAVLGLVLLAARRARPRTAVKAAVILLAVLVAFYALLAGFSFWAESVGRNTSINVFDDPSQMIAAYRGGPLDVIGENLALLPGMLSGIWFMQAGSAMAMFLFGFAAGQVRLLEDVPRRWLVRAQWLGFTAGLAGSLAVGVTHLVDHSGSGALLALDLTVTTATAPLLAAAYAATLLRISNARPGIARALAPAGRLSASNYLGQSALMALLFTGYGLALFAKASPPLLLGIAAAVFAGQLLLSAWWTRSHRYGPAEWWLRTLTHGR